MTALAMKRVAAEERSTTTQASAKDRSDKITPADLKLLQANPSPETRSGFAAKFGRQYDDFVAASSSEFAEAILHHLARDVEATVRQALAEAIAESPNLPEKLAVALATDEIEIARPILERSPVLRDPQLTEIVRSHAMQYALAIAGRETLSEDVADALVGSENVEVIARLLTNTGAHISIEALRLIASDYKDHKPVQDRLIERPDLPPAIVDQLLDVIGEQLQWDLITSRSMEADEARKLIDATKGKTARALATQDKVLRATMAGMQERMAVGGLNAIDILGYLRDCDVCKFEAALATMARLDLRKAKGLLYNMDKRALAVLCLRAGLGTPQYLAVRMALDLADNGVSEARAQRVHYPAKVTRFVQEQYERIRGDKKVMSQFL